MKQQLLFRRRWARPLRLVIIVVSLLFIASGLSFWHWARKQGDVRAWIAHKFHVRIGYTQLQWRWNDFQPQIRLRGVKVADATQKSSMPLSLKSVSIQFNLWASLWHWSPMANRIRVKGFKIQVQQQKDGQYRFIGFSGTKQHPVKWQKIAPWLSRQQNIYLQGVDVLIQRYQRSRLSLSNVNLLWQQLGSGQYFVSAFSEIENNQLGQFSLQAKLSGSLTALSVLRSHFYLSVTSNRLATLMRQFYPQQSWLHTASGEIQLWGEAQHRHITQLQTILQFHHVGLLIHQQLIQLGAIEENALWQRSNLGWQIDAQPFPNLKPNTLALHLNLAERHTSGAAIYQWQQLSIKNTSLDLMGLGQLKVPLVKNKLSWSAAQVKTLEQFHVQHVYQFLHKTIAAQQRQPTGLLAFLQHNLAGAPALSGTLLWHGAFKQNQKNNRSDHVFQLGLCSNDLNIRPYQGWPIIQHTQALLLLDDSALTIGFHGGAAKGIRLSGGRLSINNIFDQQSPLRIHLRTHTTSASNAIHYLSETPIGHGLKWITKSVLTGHAQAHLSLVIPRLKNPHVVLSGKVDLYHINAQLPWHVTLTDLNGPLMINNGQFSVDKLTAKLMGQPLVIANGQDDHGLIHIQGVMPLHELFKYMPNWQEAITGSLPFDLSLYTEHQHMVATLDSDGIGMGIHLPYFLDKSPVTLMPVRLHADLTALPIVQLQLGDRLFIKVKPHNKAWRLQLNGQNIAGSISVGADQSHQPQIDANLSKLTLQSASNSSGLQQQKPAQKLNALTKRLSHFPTLNLHIDKLNWNQETLGSLKWQSQPIAGGISWQQLDLSNAIYHAQLMGSLQQLPKQSVIKAQAQGTVSAKDWGEMLSYFGQPNLVTKGGGQVSFNLNWQGSNTGKLELKNIVGGLAFDLQQGAISHVDVGFLKFLGVFNFSDWLTGFSSIQSKGLPFSQLHGSYTINNGIAQTQNVRLTGSAMDVLTKGEINLAKQTLDQSIVVIPHLDGGIALAAGVVGGPIVGIAAWLGEKLLSHTVLHDKGIKLQVTGPWKHPKIIKQN